MQPDAGALLWDARHAAGLVQQFVADLTIDAFVGDVLVASAVERQLAIIGEALNRLSKVDPETADSITDLGRIVGLRNILVHGYTSVDRYLVWQLVATNLPTLMVEIDGLLGDQSS